MTGQRLTPLITLSILFSLLLTFALIPAATAQEPCGPTVTVTRGDTLARIAARCNTTIDALLAANPSITDPSLIYTGQVLNIPGPSVPAVQPQVAVYPTTGGPGTVVDVIANGYPANAEVEVGIGGPNAEFQVLQMARTTDRGGLQTQVAVPANFGPQDPWLIVVRTADRTIGAVSGGVNPVVGIMPLSGPTGTMVDVTGNNFPPNMEVTVGFGPPDSEYSVVGTARTNAQGALDTQIVVPDWATTGQQYVVFIETGNDATSAASAPFLVTEQTAPPTPAPQPAMVTLSPLSGPPGTNIQVSATGFPPNARLVLGLGRANSEFSVMYNVVSDAQGNLNVQVQIPTYADPNAPWVAVVQTRDGAGIEARSGIFNVTAPGGAPPPATPTPQQDRATFTSAETYLIALNDGGQSGQQIGCGDSLVPITVQFPATVAPLTASLEQLFAIQGEFYGQSGLYNPFYQSNLQVQGIDIDNGHATINLSGSLVTGGVCDAPRIEAILRQTALQYSTIDSVTINVNGTPLEQLLSGQ